METKEQQFMKAYKENADALFRYCYLRVSDRELALDLLQNVCLNTWQFIQKGGVVNNMRSFLFTTAHNLVIDEYRKKKSVSLDAMRDEGFDVHNDKDNIVEDRIDGERAVAFLATIPKMYREAIYMQYVEGLSVKEIAEITGESENNISVRIHRGLQKLRSIMKQT